MNELCSDLFLAVVANLMEGMRDYDPFCGSIVEWHIIVHERFMNNEAHRYTALKLWKEKIIEKGTYFELILVLLENENFQLANEVVSLLDLELAPQLVTEVFKGYLAKYYNMLFPPAIPSQPHEVPIEIHTVSFQDTFVPMVVQIHDGQESKFVQMKSFKDIFKSRSFALSKLHNTAVNSDEELSHLTILEGVAGSGKSNLCWQMSQKWHSQELFQEFPMFVFISLKDPAACSAKILGDFIPHPCEQVREVVAAYISENEGEGVALVVDGIDEALIIGQGLSSPFLETLVDAIFEWKKACVLITSRPCSLQVEFLKSCVTKYESISCQDFL